MQVADPEPLTLSVEEVAARLGIGRSLAYELARADRLPVPVIKLGKRMVVSRILVDRLLAGEVSPPIAARRVERTA